MQYISVKEAALKFNLSERRVQKLCETNRIDGVQMISGVWVIPADSRKPVDERANIVSDPGGLLSLKELCDELSISLATGKNWIKLGKITPCAIEKNIPFFTFEYITDLKKDIKSGKNAALKSRRNKKYVSGNVLYNSYVSEDCQGIKILQSLLSQVEDIGLDLNLEIIQLFIADCAIHMFVEKNNINRENHLLKDYLNGVYTIGNYDELILDLIVDKEKAIHHIENYPSLFSLDYKYEKGEDVLGLIYISCKNIGNRKATGSYYTSTKVVKRLISHIDISQDNTIMDPCCGTGNFLLQLPECVSLSNVFGNDTDPTSVKITRLNMALRYDNADVALIKKNITESDYFSLESAEGYDHIIGNPPWGYEFSEESIRSLKERFNSAKGKNIESYDVFVEKAIDDLRDNGSLSFVLPEAILNVKAHTAIREVVIARSSVQYLDYLGNAFDGVQCPCIIMQLKRTDGPLSTIGMVVNDGKKVFSIDTDRTVTPEYFSFLTTDSEYGVLSKVINLQNVRYLRDNADFALGIVTGNNKEYISSVKTNENEMVLKGADISKYHINSTNNYIVFKPESFQQIAPAEMYRAKEKLLYRFICNQLVFAYDDKGTLSLNSCNIVIPKLKENKIKYILAVLNSRVAQFIYKKQFNSVKVLRSHIESIPIPQIAESEQDKIIAVIDKLICGCEMEQAEQLYDEVDNMIFDLFALNDEERKIIIESVDGENKFLA